MTKKIKELAINFLTQFKSGATRFPETIVLSTLCVIIGIIMVHLDYSNEELLETLGKVLMTLILGLPLTAAIKLVVEKYQVSIKIRAVIDVFVIGGLGIYYMLIPKEMNEQFMFKYFMLNIIFYLAFTLVPYFYKRKHYSAYVLTLITNFFITCLFSLALLIGIDSMLLAIDFLFEVNIDSEVYVDIFIAVSGLFAVNYFLGSVPSKETNIEEAEYSKIWKVLFMYIMSPILCCYSAILYAYFTKIIITWDWSKISIGSVVIWYGIIGAIVVFFLHTLRDKNEWIEKFSKYFPFVVLLPLVMMFYGIWLRIGDYGITVLRYLLIAGGLWTLINMLYLGISKNIRTTFMTTTGIIVLLIAVYGPFNAYGISIWNQNNRFESLLTEYNMIENNKIIKREDLDDEEKSKINEHLSYFNNHFELSDLEILPEEFDLDTMSDVFGFEYKYSYRYENEDMDREYINYHYYDGSMLMNVSEYDYILDINAYRNNQLTETMDGIEVLYDGDKNLLTIKRDGEILYTKDFVELGENYHQQRNNVDPETIDDIRVEDGNEAVNVAFYILGFYGEKANANAPLKLDSLDLKLLIKIKE